MVPTSWMPNAVRAAGLPEPMSSDSRLPSSSSHSTSVIGGLAGNSRKKGRAVLSGGPTSTAVGGLQSTPGTSDTLLNHEPSSASTFSERGPGGKEFLVLKVGRHFDVGWIGNPKDSM